jgi:hypothetical protein
MRALWALFLLVASAPAVHLNPVEYRLERQMRFWQKRLGLESWKIDLRIQRQKAMGDVWGTAEWDDEKKVAVVSVLDPRDYNLRGGELKLDLECTIVHELVHIQVSPLDAPNANVREDVVNKIMGALVNRPCPN